MHLRSSIHKNPRLNFRHIDFPGNQLSHPIVRAVIERNNFEGMSGLTFLVCLLMLSSGRAHKITHYGQQPQMINPNSNGMCSITNTTNAYQFQSNAYSGHVSNNVHSAQNYFDNAAQRSSKNKNKNKKKKKKKNSQNEIVDNAENKYLLKNLTEELMTELPNIDAIRVQLTNLATRYADMSYFLQPLLRRAVPKGDIGLVKMLLDAGADPNGIGESIQPLVIATTYQLHDIANLLVERGARATHLKKEITVVKDSQSATNILYASEGSVTLTSLHVAVLYDPESINTVLDEGADIEADTSQGVKPLILAAKYSRKSLEILLQRGANVNSRQWADSWTPLHAAAKWNTDCIPLLIKNGANLTALDRNGLTPLHVAAAENHSAIPLLLAQKVPVDPNENMLRMTPLHMACEAKNFDSVVALLNHGASPNAQMVNGRTPLHIAVLSFEKALPNLLQKGGDPNLRDFIDRSTSLDMAIHTRRTRAVKLLLQHEAIYNRRNLKTLDRLISDPGYEAEIFQILDKHEQALAERKKQKIISFIKENSQPLITVMKYLLIFLPMIIIGYIIHRFNIKTRVAKAREVNQACVLTALNKLTKDIYYDEWIVIDAQKYSLKTDTWVPLCIDPDQILRETLKALGTLRKEFNKVEKTIIVKIKPGQDLPTEEDARRLAKSIEHYSPEYKLYELNKTLVSAKSITNALITEYAQKRADIKNKNETVSIRKQVLIKHQNGDNIDLRRKMVKLIGSAETVLRRAETWLNLPLSTLEVLHTEVDDKYKELSLDITNKRITHSAFTDKYDAILSQLKNLRDKHKEYLEVYNNSLRDIIEKTSEVMQPLCLPEEENIAHQPTEVQVIPAEASGGVEADNGVIIELIPILTPASAELEVINNDVIDVQHRPANNPVQRLNLEPDIRHMQSQPILVSAPRPKQAELPTLNLSFFAENLQSNPKKKTRERPKGNPMLHVSAADQEAHNLSACIAKLQKTTDIFPLEIKINTTSSLYFMMRFLKSLWHLFLFDIDNPEIAPAVAKLRHVLVHVASKKYRSITFRPILIEGGTRLKNLLSEPYMILCKEKRVTFIPDLVKLIESFPRRETPLFNLTSNRLTFNEILDGLVEAINDIKNIGKIFTTAKQLDKVIDRAASIKWLIIEIGEYCVSLEEDFPKELITVSSLFPMILWENFDKDAEIIPVTEVCKLLRNQACHMTKEIDGKYLDIDAGLLFRLISSLIEFDLTKPKILEQLERKDRIVCNIMKQVEDHSFRKSISPLIVEVFENEKMTAPPDVLELLFFRNQMQTQLNDIKQTLAVKYQIKDPEKIMQSFFAMGEEADIAQVNAILKKIHVNFNALLEACIRRETCIRYANAIEGGLQIGDEVAESLLSERSALSLLL